MYQSITNRFDTKIKDGVRTCKGRFDSVHAVTEAFDSVCMELPEKQVEHAEYVIEHRGYVDVKLLQHADEVHVDFRDVAEILYHLDGHLVKKVDKGV